MDMIVELHCHTNYSDGIYPVEKVVKYASKFLDAIAITDHNTIKATRFKTDEIIIIPGCEFSLPHGHILIYGLEEMPKNREDIFDFAKERDLPVVQAHPFKNTKLYDVEI